MEIVWKPQSLLALKVERETLFRHPTFEGLSLRVYPSGRKTWLWIRQFEGKQLRPPPFGRFPTKSLADAQDWASALNRAIDEGRNPLLVEAAPEPLPEPERVTVKEAWERYIEDCEERGCKSVGKRDQAGQLDIVAKIGTKFVRDVILVPLAPHSAHRSRSATLPMLMDHFRSKHRSRSSNALKIVTRRQRGHSTVRSRSARTKSAIVSRRREPIRPR